MISLKKTRQVKTWKKNYVFICLDFTDATICHISCNDCRIKGNYGRIVMKSKSYTMMSQSFKVEPKAKLVIKSWYKIFSCSVFSGACAPLLQVVSVSTFSHSVPENTVSPARLMQVINSGAASVYFWGCGEGGVCSIQSTYLDLWWKTV